MLHGQMARQLSGHQCLIQRVATGEKLKITVRVVPNASRNEIVGWVGDELKIKVQAPAEGGRANKALLEFLAKALKLSRREITIATGEKSRHKVLQFASLTLNELKNRIAVSISDNK